jgi:hypothetical protein
MRIFCLSLLALAAVALSGCGGSDVTRARRERSLPPAFERLYVQQAQLLGHKGITTANLHAKAQCDKGGPKVADHGPGADWICLMTWHDPNLPADTLPGKFEVNAHSNDCYTAGGPSKVVGSFTVTDTHGRDVDNPVFEFDVCFNPTSSDAPTGIAVATPAASATAVPPAALALPSGPIAAAADGSINLTLRCSHGNPGCAGALDARLGQHIVGTATYAIAPGQQMAVHFHIHGKPQGSLTLTANPAIGTAPTTPRTLTLRQG